MAHRCARRLILLALAVLPALADRGVVFWLWGRERSTGYDREYEQEPPTETQPALVPTLLRQGGSAGSYEFTATLFDLIRRGHYKAEPVTTERSTWVGLRDEQVADLELSAGDAAGARPWSARSRAIVDDVLDGGSERLSRFRDEIEDERATMSTRFDELQERRRAARSNGAAGSARSAPSGLGRRRSSSSAALGRPPDLVARRRLAQRSTRAGATSSWSRSASARSSTPRSCCSR